MQPLLCQQQVTIATYHSLDNLRCGLFYPDPKYFKYHRDVSKCDKDFLSKSIRLIRSETYLVLKLIFGIFTDINKSSINIEYQKLSNYGDLPVDVLLIRRKDTLDVVVINPNHRAISVHTLKKYLEDNTYTVQEVSASGEATHVFINTAVQDKTTSKVFRNIKPVSLTVFSLEFADRGD